MYVVTPHYMNIACRSILAKSVGNVRTFTKETILILKKKRGGASDKCGYYSLLHSFIELGQLLFLNLGIGSRSTRWVGPMSLNKLRVIFC